MIYHLQGIKRKEEVMSVVALVNQS